MSKYEVLGVSRVASFQEIKSAYQAAALASHPDKQASIAAEALKKEVRVRLWSLRSCISYGPVCDCCTRGWSSNQTSYFALRCPPNYRYVACIGPGARLSRCHRHRRGSCLSKKRGRPFETLTAGKSTIVEWTSKPEMSSSRTRWATTYIPEGLYTSSYHTWPYWRCLLRTTYILVLKS